MPIDNLHRHPGVVHKQFLAGAMVLAHDHRLKKGRAWLAEQPLPPDECCAIEQRLRALDSLGEDLAVIDRALAKATLDNEQVHRLRTISGVNVTVAISLVAAIGDIGRFASPQKLVSYFGLNPRVRQSGLAPARHGRISKVGRSHARGMLVEAAWAAAHSPGPLRAFFRRIKARRGMQIAAVATARKLAVITWHVLAKEQDYDWKRPAPTQKKRRTLELQAGCKASPGNRSPGQDVAHPGYCSFMSRNIIHPVMNRSISHYPQLLGQLLAAILSVFGE